MASCCVATCRTALQRGALRCNVPHRPLLWKNSIRQIGCPSYTVNVSCGRTYGAAEQIERRYMRCLARDRQARHERCGGSKAIGDAGGRRYTHSKEL
jgi:hypothetical protein